jgi:Family of unknown function (DUF6526)
MRHQTLTGKPLDPRLTKAQIVALRFASDGEFPALASEAAGKNLPAKEVKRAIKKWRADHHRL